VDWDGDGRLDIIVGDREGEIHFFKRLSYGNIYLEEQDPVRVAGKPIDVGYNSAPCVADWNGDGLPDLVVGNLSPLPAGVFLFVNSGSPFSPEYLVTDTVFCQGGVIELTAAYPDMHDMDFDGLSDLLVGSANGNIACYLNSGTPSQPVFDTVENLRADGEEIYICSYVRPSVCDWNGDGCPDLMVADYTGVIFLYMGVPPAGVEPGSCSGVNLVRNPAVHGLELTVSLESAASGWAEVFSLDGRLVVSAPLGELPPGRSTVAIPGELAPGVYLLRFNAGNSVSVLRATVLR